MCDIEEWRQTIMASKLIKAGEPFTAGDISRLLSNHRRRLKVTNDQAHRLLRGMVKDGLLETFRVGKRTYYRERTSSVVNVHQAWVKENGIRLGMYCP